MTHSLSQHPDPTGTASQLIDLLERRGARNPDLAEELQRHHALNEAMADHTRRAEHALLAWQAALARRWSCEVAAQRACQAVQRRIETFHDRDTLHSAPRPAPATPGAAYTPRGLLEELRRLVTTLELLGPQGPISPDMLAQLRCTGDELEVAITQTAGCEAERRSMVSEQRVVARLVERANARALRLLADPPPEGEQP